MACIQNSKKNKRCSNPSIQDEIYTGYCKYHVNRFKIGKDTPNPVIIAELAVEEVDPLINDLPGLPPLPIVDGDIVENPVNIQIPQLNAMPVAFDFDERNNISDQNIDIALNKYIDNHRDEIIEKILPTFNLQQKDDILIEMVMQTNEDERGFLIANYERLFDLVHALVMPIPRRIEFNNINIPNDPPAGLINMVLAALGFGGNEEVVQEPLGPPRQRELRDLVQDDQNVHTKELVEPIIENAKKMIKLSQKKSPDQDTFKDIVYECKLSDNARKQLCFMYYSDEKIYNLKAPTYRHVLDGIWSFVLKQKDDVKKDILSRMSQELEDNVGMCAQGNLSRIINILSGFMDDLKQEYKESIQDKMAKISKIEDKETRLKKAREILKKDKIPENQWEAWLEAME
jgi:hypothetical protein